MEGVGIIFTVGHAGNHAETLLIQTDEASGQPFGRRGDNREIQPGFPHLLIRPVADMPDNALAQLLRGFGFAMVLTDQGLETFGQPNEADGQRAVLEDFTHLVIRSELVGIDPDALPHEEGIVAHLLDALGFQTLQKLVEHQGNPVVQTRKKGVHVTTGKDTQPGQIQGGEAQIAASVDDFTPGIMRVADNSGAASHIGDFRLGVSRPVVDLVERRINKGKIREQTPGGHPAGKAEQIVVRLSLAVVDAFLHLEDMDGENRRFSIAQPGLGSQQHVADDHAAFGGGVGPVVDGAERDLRSGAGVHGVEVVHQRFHRLIRGLLGVLKGLLDGEVDVQGGGVLSEDLPDEGKALFIEDGFVFLNVGAQPGLYSILALHIVEIKDQAQFLDEGLGDAGGEAVFEIRDALPAVLVVLIGLNGDAGKGAVAADIVGFAQEAVARAEAALEQRLDVDLAAGGGQAQEIKVVDVDVAVLVREAVLRVEDVHLVELLGTFAAVTQHHAHSGVAVDVGVLALEIVVLGVLEGEVADGGHEPGVHFPDLGPLVAVQDVRLGGAGMAALDKGFFYQILHLFHIGDGVLELLIEALQHFGGYLERKDIILPSLTAGGTEDCLSDLVHVKRNNACVTFPDRTNHSSSHSL